MDKFEEQLTRDIKTAGDIERLFSTPAWKILELMYEDRIQALDSVQGIATTEELKARQMAIEELKNWWGSIQSLVEKGVQAKHQLENKVDTY